MLVLFKPLKLKESVAIFLLLRSSSKGLKELKSELTPCISNGVDRGYTWSYTTPLSKMKFAIAIEEGFYASNSSALGKEISYEIVSDHSKLQFTYPTGTTDICGTPL